MKLKDLYLKYGRAWIFDNQLHIQEIEKGFVINDMYFPSIKDSIPYLEKILTNAFENK